MQYHQTDAEGFFVGTFDAKPSPLEPGAWLIPGGGVLGPDPVIGPDQCARWADGAWEILPDLRGRVYYMADHSRHMMTERGQALPPGALDADPPKTPAEIEAEDSAAALRELAALDLASIRDIRAYIAAKPDAPAMLKDREALAVAARARVRV